MRDPKEKAIELIDSFTCSSHAYPTNYSDGLNYRCGLAEVCTKEVLTQLNKMSSKDNSDLQYWNEVSFEINKIKNK